MLRRLVFSSVLLLSGAAIAQTPTPGGTMAPLASPAGTAAPPGATAPQAAMGHTASTAPANLSAADTKFIDKLASANAAEIQAGQLAEQKASDPKIKDIAQTMVTDHTEAGQKLTALAEQKGVKVPSDLDPADQKQIDTFNKLDGKKFDRIYVKDQIKDHKEVLALLKKEASTGKDPDIKALADQLTPTIQKHLDMLQNKTVS
jgi:putative membrane protein